MSLLDYVDQRRFGRMFSGVCIFLEGVISLQTAAPAEKSFLVV
jgi:hypothetical protein